MRSNSALHVDAGYLIAAAATRLTGSSLRRGVKVDYERLISDLVAEVEKRSGLPLLRVYWYDAGRKGIADADQERIALLPRVKLRLGRVPVELAAGMAELGVDVYATIYLEEGSE